MGGFFKLYLDDYPESIQYIVSLVRGSSLTLSHEEFRHGGIKLEDLLGFPFKYIRDVEVMTLNCDAIGKDGLDVVAKFLRYRDHIVSLSLNDVSLCAIILECGIG